MNPFKKYGLKVQFNVFVLTLLMFLFTFLGVFIYQYAKWSISTRNSLRMQGQIEDFVDMFDLHKKQKNEQIKQQMAVADFVFQEQFVGKLRSDRSGKIKYLATNQQTNEQYEVAINKWYKNDLLIQNNTSIVDKIQSLGAQSVSIFQKFEKGYLRISTNVRHEDGTRAVGTFIPNGSPILAVVESGNDYSGRSYELNDWYDSYYSPIRINGEIEGMLYVGELDVDLDLLKEKFYHKDILKSGHPFIISNSEDSRGLAVVDKYIEGENWLSSENENKRNYFQSLLNAYHNDEKLYTEDTEGESTIKSFETRSPLSENTLVVFFDYFQDYEYFIGVVIPKKAFISNALNTLFFIVIGVIFLFTVISVLLVSRFVKRIVHQLNISANAIQSISMGRLPADLELIGDDEITRIGKSLNHLKYNFENSAHFALEIGKENFDDVLEVNGDDDLLGNALIRMRDNLRDLTFNQKNINWIQSSTNKLNSYLREDMNLSDLCNGILAHLSEILDFRVGTLYINYDNTLKMVGSYAYTHRKSNLNEIMVGEGIVGQAALEKKVLVFDNPPNDYMIMQSGLGESNAKRIIVIPLLYKDEVVAVMELARAHLDKDEYMISFLDNAKEPIAVAIQSILVSEKMKNLLSESIKQKNEAEKSAQELAASEEELRQTNEMMAEQTNALKKSEKELQEQQEELRVINEELQEKTHSLEIQSDEVQTKNNELEKARIELERRAAELEQSSKYKSEFLANMSHELRTPLNSLLILSRDLSENRASNLSNDEVESAEVIYNSGMDLLNLINDILDLSKIEAGKMPINLEHFDLVDIQSKVKASFERMMAEKKLKLGFKIDERVPETFVTDPQRLDQIIKNLMSNAIKFTKQGSIDLVFERPDKTALPAALQHDHENFIAISVKDTGIGIAIEQQQAIFDAFQQADGSTSRKFGGTGLGLSITKELIHLLGGSIELESTEGVGSRFTIYHPIVSRSKINEAAPKKEPVKEKSRTSPPLADIAETAPPDLNAHARLNLDQLYMSLSASNYPLFANKRTILIIDNNEATINALIKQSHDKGFNALAAITLDEGYEIALTFQPHAIVLSLEINSEKGWDLMEKLKKTEATKDIPVHLIGQESVKSEADKQGAIGLLSEPINDKKLKDTLGNIENFINASFKKILLVEDDNNLRLSLRKLIRRPKTDILEVATANSAMEALKSHKIDCMILDLGLPDMSGIELLESIKDCKNVETPPTIIYTGKDLSVEENEKLCHYTDSIIIKGERSEERLLDETALFLHKIRTEDKQVSGSPVVTTNTREEVFQQKTMMIVDDDMRNVFALSKVLQNKGMKIIKAGNGLMALEQLKKHPEIDFVLMDIMMPDMDGYETMREIRKQNKYQKLPIVALTAKAMKGDKEKCIAAGANDYLSKPLDVDHLLSLMKVWLYN
jgi:signal transduction histidine kinase/DNA-binding response OmpR family regulator/putative methionine-R-sulfoxide reductase with GAF domain